MKHYIVLFACLIVFVSLSCTLCDALSVNVKSIACGDTHNVALLDDGTVITWGTPDVGGQERLLPSRIRYLTNVTQVGGGNCFTVALKDDGTVWLYDFKLRHKLEGGHIPPEPAYPEFEKDYPVQIPGLSNITAISVRSLSLMAVRDDGSVWGWGLNYDGGLGNGTGVRSYNYTVLPVRSSISDVRCLSVGGAAVKNDGTVWRWGENPPLMDDGTGHYTYQNSYRCTVDPIEVPGLKGAVDISYAAPCIVAVMGDGSVWSVYGTNYCGQLGDGSETGSFYVNIEPRQARISDVKNAVYADGIVFALKDDGTVWSWGQNICGTLGDGTTKERSLPVQVLGLSNITQIAISANNGMALDEDGNVWVWGDGSYGQLGDGITENEHWSLVPVKVDLSGAISEPVITATPTPEPVVISPGVSARPVDNSSRVVPAAAGSMVFGVWPFAVLILLGYTGLTRLRRKE